MGTVATAVLLAETTAQKAPETQLTDSKTQFYLTGFGTFRGVKDNPTERLIHALHECEDEDDDSKQKLPKAIVLSHTCVLKVAAETVRAKLEQIYAKVRGTSDCVRQVMLHFGVNTGITCFNLEKFARNEATFTIPDENGWTPIMQPIDPSYGAITAIRRTTIDVEGVVKQLRHDGHQVDISCDAGRFVCNWIYFHSLTHSSKKLLGGGEVASLFVHVPPLASVPLDRQLSFTHALMGKLAV